MIGAFRLIRRFRDEGATHPTRARTLHHLNIQPNAVFNRMVRAHVLVRTKGDAYYVDERAANRFRRETWTRLSLAGLIIIAAALIISAAL